ncbi:hypothetical protein, conserved [Babesia bigemina]|uniref:Uncharacterized protein n=1 Tax=Babesia bigemina TaxID=5866 RepID=A0A061D4A3_BABBI|nr:hypothetical protein, conserved [Babesia bigemina]CDR95571.1 hypothetical protein, conserved [Babesia bigemina]|eukprot:XP_012767757.1 hypothetical protein, conserved [Babesia bigemina]
MDSDWEAEDVQSPRDGSGGEAPQQTQTGTHLSRIPNQSLAESEGGGDMDGNAAETSKNEDELPEGWVRHGKGLMLEVPITPRMIASERNKLPPPHFKFTADTNRRSAGRLQAALLHIDRDAVRRMKNEQNVRVRAARPASDGQEADTSSPMRTRDASMRCYRSLRENQHTASPISRAKGEEQFDRKIAFMKKEHERQLIEAKRQVLEHVDVLIKKYRQLAIDAVKVAREEQKKAEAERRNTFEACARYEAELKANVRNAIAHLKLSSQAEHDRIAAERDALQRRCADMTPKAEAWKPALDRITAQLAAKFKGNQKFTIGIIDDTRDMIIDEFHAFKASTAELMVQKFVANGCDLQNQEAEQFVEHVLMASGATNRSVCHDEQEHQRQWEQQRLQKNIHRTRNHVSQEKEFDRVLADAFHYGDVHVHLIRVMAVMRERTRVLELGKPRRKSANDADAHNIPILIKLKN